ncbi:MAG: hypothetical protein AAB493_01750 [Patescibacteria group bacterium]
MKTPEVIYPYLPEGHTIMYVSGNNEFIREAKRLAFLYSTDRRMPTGAVIVRSGDNAIVAKESSKASIKNSKLLAFHKKYCIRRFLKIPSGQKYWMCPGCAGGNRHAEYRASEKLIKNGFNKDGQFDLYLWGHWWACKDCWSKMLEIPIRYVFVLEGSEILFNEKVEGNIIGHQLDEFYGK